MKTVVAIQARLNSERLPKKVLADLHGRPMLSQIARRCKAARVPVYVSCPPDDEEEMRKACPELEYVPGPETDVLGRMLLVAAAAKATHVVRVTADCPLVPHDLIRTALEQADKSEVGCVQNWRPRTFPDGFDFEVWYVPFLVSLRARLKPEHYEYFAQYCLEKGMPNIPITYAGSSLAHIRLTVDYQEDLDVVREIYEAQGEAIWESGEVVRWCEAHPSTMALNASKIDGKFGAKA